MLDLTIIKKMREDMRGNRPRWSGRPEDDAIVETAAADRCASGSSRLRWDAQYPTRHYRRYVYTSNGVKASAAPVNGLRGTERPELETVSLPRHDVVMKSLIRIERWHPSGSAAAARWYRAGQCFPHMPRKANGGPMRLRCLRCSAVYRQNASSQIALYPAALLRRACKSAISRRTSTAEPDRRRIRKEPP